VGGIETVKVDIRVVAATNRNLKQAVAQGTFKQDLFDRLNVIPLQTPSLREIREDIPALVERFIEDLRYVNVVKGVSAEALDALTGYHWPGNTRQLRNVVEYALNFAEREGLIQPEHLPETVWEEPEGMSAASLDAKVDEARRAAIEKAVQESGGNMERTAAKLGITTRHLRRLRRLLAEG
jgi:transcriptional regulator with PAS, ATPase and Fis domain